MREMPLPTRAKGQICSCPHNSFCFIRRVGGSPTTFRNAQIRLGLGNSCVEFGQLSLRAPRHLKRDHRFLARHCVALVGRLLRPCPLKSDQNQRRSAAAAVRAVAAYPYYETTNQSCNRSAFCPVFPVGFLNCVPETSLISCLSAKLFCLRQSGDRTLHPPIRQDLGGALGHRLLHQPI
jgi:hypothetical protein